MRFSKALLPILAVFMLGAFSNKSFAKDKPVPEMTPAPDPAAAPVASPDAASAEKKSPTPPEEGMRMYFLGLLYRGDQWTAENTAETAKIQEGHMANIGRLAKDGKLILAGPFGGDGDLRGLFLFDATTVEEARAFADTDPAVKAGRLRIDLIPWYGPKGIRYEGMAASE